MNDPKNQPATPEAEAKQRAQEMIEAEGSIVAQYIMASDKVMAEKIRDSLSQVLAEAIANLPQEKGLLDDLKGALNKGVKDVVHEVGASLQDEENQVDLDAWFAQLKGGLDKQVKDILERQFKNSESQEILLKNCSHAVKGWARNELKGEIEAAILSEFGDKYKKALKAKIEREISKDTNKLFGFTIRSEWRYAAIAVLACIIFFFLGRFVAPPVKISQDGNAQLAGLDKDTLARINRLLSHMEADKELNDRRNNVEPATQSQATQPPNTDPPPDQNRGVENVQQKRRAYFEKVFSETEGGGIFASIHQNPITVYEQFAFEHYNTGAASFETQLAYFRTVSIWDVDRRSKKVLYIFQRLVYEWALDNRYFLDEIPNQDNFLQRFGFDGNWGPSSFKLTEAFRKAQREPKERYDYTTGNKPRDEVLMNFIFWLLVESA